MRRVWLSIVVSFGLFPALGVAQNSSRSPAFQAELRTFIDAGPYSKQHSWRDSDSLDLIRSANALITLGPREGLAVANVLFRKESLSVWSYYLADVPFDFAGFSTSTVDDIPYPLNQMGGTGIWSTFDEYINVTMKGKTFRKKVLSPPDDPFPSYQKLLKKYGKTFDEVERKNGFEQGHIKFLALFKLADLVQTVYRPIRRFPSDEEFEIWHQEFLGLHCRWDKVKQLLYLSRRISLASS